MANNCHLKCIVLPDVYSVVRFNVFYHKKKKPTNICTGSPISAMFLSPGVTPWKTTLPGVVDGANNPAIRVFEYDNKTLLIEVTVSILKYNGLFFS